METQFLVYCPPMDKAVCLLAGIGIHVARLRGYVPVLLVLMDGDPVWAVGVRFPWHTSSLPIEFYWGSGSTVKEAMKNIFKFKLLANFSLYQ